MNIGVTLLIVGMGTVFAFLVLLVVVMQAAACVLDRFFPDSPELPAENLPEIAAAVVAAHAHFSPSGRNSSP